MYTFESPLLDTISFVVFIITAFAIHIIRWKYAKKRSTAYQIHFIGEMIIALTYVTSILSGIGNTSIDLLLLIVWTTMAYFSYNRYTQAIKVETAEDSYEAKHNFIETPDKDLRSIK